MTPIARIFSYTGGEPEADQLYCKVQEEPFVGEAIMPKALCLTGSVIAILMLLVFGLDLAIGFPFRRASTMMDVGLVISSLALGYVSWTTLKEQK